MIAFIVRETIDELRLFLARIDSVKRWQDILSS